MISFLYRLINIIFSLFIGLNIFRLTDSFLTIKNKLLFRIISIIGLSAIGSVAIYISDFTNITFTLLGYFIIITICYKENIIKKISVIVLFYPLIVSINSFTGSLFTEFYLTYRYSFIIELKIMFIAITWQIIYLLVNNQIIHIKKYITNKIWIFIDIISLASFSSVIVSVIFTDINKEYEALLVMPMCFISNLALLFSLKYITEGIKMHIDNTIYKFKAEYYISLEKEQKETRKIRHDINNHLQIINSYINNNNVNEAKKYLQKLKCIINKNHSKSFCNNNIVNAIVNNKYSIIKKNHIENNIQISLSNNLNIDDIDLCSIFANTLDNSIESCKKIKNVSQRYIGLKARLNKGYFVYSISNSKNSAVFINNEKIISDKSDKINHGIGLDNVNNIVTKYKGDIDISFTENSFSITIIIPLI